MKSDSYEYKNRFSDGIPISTGHPTCPFCRLALSGCDCGFGIPIDQSTRSSIRKGLEKLNGLFTLKK